MNLFVSFRSNKVEKKERRDDRKTKKDLKRKKAEEKKERECDSDDLEELEKDFKILKKLKKGKVIQHHINILMDQTKTFSSLPTYITRINASKNLWGANDHLIKFQLIEIVIYQLIEISLIT